MTLAIRTERAQAGRSDSTKSSESRTRGIPPIRRLISGATRASLYSQLRRIAAIVKLRKFEQPQCEYSRCRDSAGVNKQRVKSSIRRIAPACAISAAVN